MPENKTEEKDNEDKKGINFLSELFAFLEEHSIIGMAIGVIIAQTTTALVNSIVKGLFTPLIDLMVPGQRLDNLVFSIGNSNFDIGAILNALLTFLIIIIFLYLIVKKILKKEKWLNKK